MAMAGHPGAAGRRSSGVHGNRSAVFRVGVAKLWHRRVPNRCDDPSQIRRIRYISNRHMTDRVVRPLGRHGPYRNRQRSSCAMNVKTLCLGILYFGEATGYEIRKLAHEGCFSHFIEASYGAIYPALTRLEKDGLITCREETTPGKPSRKIYALTPEGHAALVEALGEDPRQDVFKSEFLMQTVCAALIPAAHLERILAARTTYLEGELAHLQAEMAAASDPGTRFAIGYGEALTRAALSHVRSEGPVLMAALRQSRHAAE